MGHRQRDGRCGATSRRRPICPRGDPSNGEPNLGQHGRCRLWFANDATIKSDQRWHAAIQIRWQHLPHHYAKPTHWCPPQRMAHRLSRIQSAVFEQCCIRSKLQLLRLRHSNHPADDWFPTTDHRTADTHLLW